MARADARAFAALALVAALTPGCAKQVVSETDVGRHHVRFVLPRGWEHLDHGRQQIFRVGESQLALTDLGPATDDAVVRELRAAAALWRAGRRRDAIERVRTLRSPAMRTAPPARLAEFWRPWSDATTSPEQASDADVAVAFDSLVAGTRALAKPTADELLAYALAATTERTDREIEARQLRAIHGRTWTVVEAWNRVSHQDRWRLAYVVNDGNLLALAMDHGPFDQLGPGFEALLASLEVSPAPHLAP